MLEFVSVLMSVLMIEGALLISLNIVNLILIIKQMYENKESIKNLKKCILNFKQKVYSNEKYSSICKATVVLYGVTKLTAIWCFSVLFGVVITSNMWAIIGILMIEILIIALQVKNKFALRSEDIIDVAWLLSKIELFIQRKLPEFSFKSNYEKIRDSIYGYFKKENNAN